MIKIRLAEEKDIPDIVNVHMAAFPGFALTLLGDKFLKVLYNSFILNKDGIMIVAEYNQNVIGFVAGAIHPEYFLKN